MASVEISFLSMVIQPSYDIKSCKLRLQQLLEPPHSFHGSIWGNLHRGKAWWPPHSSMEFRKTKCRQCRLQLRLQTLVSSIWIQLHIYLKDSDISTCLAHVFELPPPPTQNLKSLNHNYIEMPVPAATVFAHMWDQPTLCLMPTLLSFGNLKRPILSMWRPKAR